MTYELSWILLDFGLAARYTRNRTVADTSLGFELHLARCLSWARLGPDGPKTRLLLYPDQRTSLDRLGWSVSCQQTTCATLQGSGDLRMENHSAGSL